MHNLKVTKSNDNEFCLEYFTSQQFNTLFMDSLIPPNTAITAFEYVDASNNLEQSLEIFLECVNANVGFQVLGCCSRGDINDFLSLRLNV